MIVEILSDSTAQSDRETKKAIYQHTFRTPEYFWFDPDTLEFVGLLLVGGVYEPIAPNESGRLWSRQLNMYLGIHDSQLRFCTAEGTLVPVPAEAAEQAQQQVEQAQQQAEQAQQQAEQAQRQVKQAQQQAEQAQQQTEQAQQQAERLAAKLKELGTAPESI